MGIVEFARSIFVSGNVKRNEVSRAAVISHPPFIAPVLGVYGLGILLLNRSATRELLRTALSLVSWNIISFQAL